MGTDSRQLEDETMAFSVDASSEPAASPEEAVSSLRELREALGRVSGLASEEDVTVESFLETLGRLSVAISRIPLEPSLLPKRLGSVEEARMNDGGALILTTPDGGALILTTPDGGIETIDLTSFDNRDLLVTVLGDLLEKLRGLVDGTHDLPKIIVDEPDIERAVVDEPIILEPPVIEEIADPKAMELFLSTPEIDMPVEEPPASIEPEPADPPVETISPAPHSPREYEPSPIPQIVEEPIFTPTVLPNSILRRFRDKALRQRNEASRRISEIRRLREAQVHRMRSGVQEPWIQEETGIFASLKKLLSRRSGKR